MATVESSQPLSIESFSYSWLMNLKPSFESIGESFRAALDSSDESSFIDMDPKMPPSKRFKKLNKDFDFDFDLPYSEQSTAAIMHADELFCNGLLMPLVGPSKSQALDSTSSPDASLFSDARTRKASLADHKIRCGSLLSRKMFEKYLYFLCPLLDKIRCCRLSSLKGRAANDRIWAVENSHNRNTAYSPQQASPRASVGSCPLGYQRRSCDSESSIHEAVLHCKRSIGM